MMPLLKFQDPDQVGSSEYRAIHHCIADALEDFDQDDMECTAEEHAASMLEEFIEHAQAMLKTLNLNPDEVEIDGGVMSWEDDGTIRYMDNHGNTEGVWEPGDEGYDQYKTDYFPNHKIEEVLREVEIMIANRKGHGFHVQTVEFTDFDTLRQHVNQLVNDMPFHKVDVELSPNWTPTDEEQAVLESIAAVEPHHRGSHPQDR